MILCKHETDIYPTLIILRSLEITGGDWTIFCEPLIYSILRNLVQQFSDYQWFSTFRYSSIVTQNCGTLVITIMLSGMVFSAVCVNIVTVLPGGSVQFPPLVHIYPRSSLWLLASNFGFHQ